MSFYQLLVIIHIFAAIVGLGPGFIMTFIVTKSSNMTELRHAYYLRNRVHIFVMVGGVFLFVTGMWMGFINPHLFLEGWYNLSLILFLITLAAGPLVLKPLSNPIKKMLVEHKGENIPSIYQTYANRLFICERFLNIIFLIIILLMIVKPF